MTSKLTLFPLPQTTFLHIHPPHGNHQLDPHLQGGNQWQPAFLYKHHTERDHQNNHLFLAKGLSEAPAGCLSISRATPHIGFLGWTADLYSLWWDSGTQYLQAGTHEGPYLGAFPSPQPTQSWGQACGPCLRTVSGLRVQVQFQLEWSAGEKHRSSFSVFKMPCRVTHYLWSH